MTTFTTRPLLGALAALVGCTAAASPPAPEASARIGDPITFPTPLPDAAVDAPQCTPAPAQCKDPESEAGSYVSIGTMPAPYPLKWSSPFDLFVTTLATSQVGLGLDRSHSIGHVLLKVRCGTAAPFFISQTGANGKKALGDQVVGLMQFADLYNKGPNVIFETHDDGHLYPDIGEKSALIDWSEAIIAQEKLVGGTYDSQPDTSKLPAAIWLLSGMGGVKAGMAALPLAKRHRFVRATIRITDAQCNAIKDWRDAYVSTGGSSRYALHRAPWVIDSGDKYDGGGCGSVSFAGAFYAAGLDYRRAAGRLIERLYIGTSRLTAHVSRPWRRDGWFNVQNPLRYAPKSIPCATNWLGDCKGSLYSWDKPWWKLWSSALKDQESKFSRLWTTGKPTKASTLPVMIFEPEKFYSEVLKTVADKKYDAFTYPGWCEIPVKYPAIALDARTLDGPAETVAGRKKGLTNGWGNLQVKIP